MTAIFTNDDAVREMVQRIVDNFRPLQVILFGSRARGTDRPDSDVDLLVVVDHAGDKRRLAIEIRRALRDAPLAKDIVVSTPEELRRRGDAVGTILRPALMEGKVLYERS